MPHVTRAFVAAFRADLHGKEAQLRRVNAELKRLGVAERAGGEWKLILELFKIVTVAHDAGAITSSDFDDAKAAMERVVPAWYRQQHQDEDD